MFVHCHNGKIVFNTIRQPYRTNLDAKHIDKKICFRYEKLNFSAFIKLENRYVLIIDLIYWVAKDERLIDIYWSTERKFILTY